MNLLNEMAAAKRQPNSDIMQELEILMGQRSEPAAASDNLAPSATSVEEKGIHAANKH